MQRIKQIIVSALALTMLAAPALAPVSVYAETPAAPAAGAATAETPSIEKNLCAGTSLSTKECEPKDEQEDVNGRINGIIATVINLFSLVVGVVSVIMIIIGGLKYITSGGDSGNVTGAKNTILYAVIGLVVVALAQFIVKFVLGRATNVGA